MKDLEKLKALEPHIQASLIEAVRYAQNIKLRYTPISTHRARKEARSLTGRHAGTVPEILLAAAVAAKGDETKVIKETTEIMAAAYENRLKRKKQRYKERKAQQRQEKELQDS